MIIPYKNRVVDVTNKVEIYRCLNRVGYVYSVKQFGKVVGHTSEINISNVEFKVLVSGKERAIKTGVRNVHARICGLICTNTKTSVNLLNNHVFGELKYYPFCYNNFTCNGIDISTSKYVIIREHILLSLINNN